jgi:hypothetical protein
MNKEFIPYEQALELKELGFDEECLAIYNINEELETGYYQNKYVIAAPLYSQAFRWFRENYGLASQFSYYHVPKWTFEILEFTEIKMTPSKIVSEHSKSRTYEEAELACLIKLIEVVKTK